MSSVTASRLAELRRAQSKRAGRRISAQEVADAVGVSRSTLSGYEGGHDEPGRATLVALATYYNVSADYLTGLDSAVVEDTQNVAHNEEEIALLGIWRRLNEEQRRSWMLLLRSMIQFDAA
ncbi:helix-turn-helix transcriptional regulator [Gluconacetobacter diazotrophicus]|uniref:Helix-turn-helix transcriptional regulator n=1 Tax=Gluconacetobacter diazotrophicus TaxID=33996 RepID=A0A7W4NGA4_GLUDI|nr:helix-turn-helix transcriptional regulator [Gluconacetobacter diazotrophicus]MBB2157227.1 helix-turn-helix transcriptional regulator [Gluconacetobacter diazotrophicus]